MSHKTVTVLTSAVIVDVGQFKKLNALQYAEAYKTITDANKPVKFIADMRDYTDEERINKNITEGKFLPEHMELYLGRPMTDAEEKSINTLAAAMATVKKLLVGDAVLYKNFAPVPLNQDIGATVKFEKDQIVRNNYSASHEACRRIWTKVSRHWTNKTTGRFLVRASMSGSTGRAVVVYDDRIEIGCQSISRWQVEQIAIRLGFVEAPKAEAPKAKAKA